MTLQQAITEIEKNHFSFQLPIQMIEFEDGTGYKFIYRLKGEQKNRFIYFKKLHEIDNNNKQFVSQFHKASEIMNKW